MRVRLLLPGAVAGDRVLACLAASAGIAIVGWVGQVLSLQGLPIVLAPVAASAVLVFAVPASPLAQPWPVFGGNVLSVLIGTAVALSFGSSAAAAGLAVAAAILTMSLLRCLHPPGGAAALLAVLGGSAVAAAGGKLPLLMAVNSATLLTCGWAFHRTGKHPYPHRAPPDSVAPRFIDADVDAALAEAGEAFDITREDLIVLLAATEAAADRRTNAGTR